MRRVVLTCFWSLFVSGLLYAQETANKLDSDGLRTGKWTIYFDASDHVVEQREVAARYYKVTYKKGKPTGFTKEYDKTGILLWEGELISIAPDTIYGIARSFFKSGKMNWEYRFVNNVMEGQATQYYENGALKWQCNYTADYPDGLYKEWYEDGGIMRQGTVRSGKKDGLFSFYRADGSVEKEVTYVIDQATGPYKEYHTNGQLKYDGYKENDNWEGLLTEYNEAGEPTDYYMLEADSVLSVYDVISNVSANLLPGFDNAYGLSQSLLLEEYFRKKYGEDSPIYPFAVSSVAQYYFIMGRKEEGKPWAIKSFELEEAAIGSDKESSADKWHLLGLMLDGFGEQKLAWEAFSLAIQKSYDKGKPTAETIAYMSRSAALTIGMGRLQEGLESYNSLMELCTNPPAEADGTCLTAALNYSSYLSSAFQDEAALIILEDRDALVKNSALENEWSLQKAEIWMNLNRTDEAMNVYQELYKGFEEDQDTMLHLEVTAKLASFYRIAANYAASERLWVEAVELSRQSTEADSLDYYGRLDDLADYYTWVGRYEEAIDLKLKSLSFRINDMETEQLLSLLDQGAASSIIVFETLDLGRLLDQTGDIETANTMFENAMSMASAYEGDSSFLYATTLEAWAGHQMETGDWDAALQNYQRAISLSDDLYAAINVNAYTWKDNLSELYIRMGQPEVALHIAEDVWMARKDKYPEGHPILLSSYSRLANIYEDLGFIDTALALNDKVLASSLKNLGASFSVMNAQEQEAFLGIFRYQFDNFNNKAARYGSAQNQAFKKMLDYQLTNKSLLLYSSQAARKSFISSADMEIRKMYDDWLKECQYLTKLEANAEQVPEDVLDTLRHRTAAIEKTLTLQAGKEVSFLPEMNTQQIADQLRDNEVYISFIRYPEYQNSDGDIWNLGALTLNQAQEVTWVPLCSENALLDRLKRKEGESEKDFIDRLYQYPQDKYELELYQGDQLYRMLWEPLLTEIPTGSRIYYSVDGALNQMNLSAIPCDLDTYMCFKYDMVWVGNPVSLASGWESIQAGSDMSVNLIGGIMYDAGSEEIMAAMATDLPPLEDLPLSVQSVISVRGGSWNFLPGTLTEVNAVSGKLQEADWQTNIITGASASEDWLKRETGSMAPNILHIATHGFFNTDRNKNPMYQTGILLAGGNQSWQGNRPSEMLEDGILTAAEVSYLDFSNTSLVVLSACETGLGKIESNEGVFGLQRAFALSGVDRIMMSMWKVSDQETALFMQQFYGFLSEGKTLHVAYQLAQKAMSTRYSPYYWAAFVFQE